MALTFAEQCLLAKIASLVDAIREEDRRVTAAAPRKPRRRSSADVQKFRKLVRDERAAGASARELASRHGVTLPYIYMILK